MGGEVDQKGRETKFKCDGARSDFHSVAHRDIAFCGILVEGHPGGPIKSVMLWFSKALANPPQFMGVHYGRDRQSGVEPVPRDAR